jgi:hypothetical protein
MFVSGMLNQGPMDLTESRAPQNIIKINDLQAKIAHM